MPALSCKSRQSRDLSDQLPEEVLTMLLGLNLNTDKQHHHPFSVKPTYNCLFIIFHQLCKQPYSLPKPQHPQILTGLITMSSSWDNQLLL